jgi:hypothetical protein
MNALTIFYTLCRVFRVLRSYLVAGFSIRMLKRRTSVAESCLVTYTLAHQINQGVKISIKPSMKWWASMITCRYNANGNSKHVKI